MHEPKQTQLIVGFVSDLMFSTKIANVAQHLGFQMEWVETAVSAALGAGISVSPAAQNLSRTQPGEALHGREGVLFEKITAWQPALLLFDLTNDQIPWQRWIAVLKSSPATRRLPILCFAPHKNGTDIEAARAAGADKVVARSKFVRDMPDLLQSYARVVDTAVLAQSCQSPLPDLALIGIRLFNQGEYYKCHDALEEAWRQETSPIRELYRSILQVGIAYFQIERGNYRGGMLEGIAHYHPQALAGLSD